MAGYKKNGLHQKVIRDKANHLLVQVILAGCEVDGRFVPLERNVQDQNDEGIDYQYELVDYDRNSIISFSIQSKGEEKTGGLRVNQKKGDGKGKISFSISIKHIDYFRARRSDAVIITLADVISGVIYWHSIQLDDEVDGLIEKALMLKPNQETITIYFDPNNKITAENFSRFIDDIKDSTLVQSYKYTTNLPSILLQPEKERIGTSLDDFYEHFREQFNVLAFIPNEILARYYPFRVTTKIPIPIGVFRISTDNEHFYKIFQAIEIIDQYSIEITDPCAFIGIDNAIEKIESIIRWLNQSQIFYIYLNREKAINIFLQPQKGEDGDLLINLRRFNFLFIFSTLYQNDLSASPFSLAYIHYKLGNFYTAQELLLIAYKEAKNGTLEQYLASYNRSKCYALLYHDYRNKSDIGKVLKDIKNISLDLAFTKCHNHKQKAAVEWVHKGDFYTKYELRIAQIVAKIKDYYYSHFEGGYSENSLVSQLVGEYGAFEGFIKQNLMFYDMYSDFSTITHLFVEGLFASYAIRSGHGSRLDEFDDYMLDKILLDGKSDEITRLVKKYKIENALYEKGVKDNSWFEEGIINLLSNVTTLQEMASAHNDGNPGAFRSQFSERVRTAFTMLSFLKLESRFVNLIVPKILDFVDKEGILYPYVVTPILLFLERQGHLLSNEEYSKFLVLFINKPSWRDVIDFGQFTEIGKKYSKKLVLTNFEFNIFFEYFFNKNSIHRKPYALVVCTYFVDIIDDSNLKQLWINQILRLLQTNFNRDAYFHLAIHDHISYDVKMFDEFKKGIILYVENIIVNKLKSVEDVKERRIYGSDDMLADSTCIDLLFDLCFKNNISLSKADTIKIKKVSNYYEWLSNISGFDYKKFFPQWITRHATFYFFREFRKHSQIKIALESYLKVHKDDLLLYKVYFSLFIGIEN